MVTFGRLSGKKGLLVVSLVMAVMLGAYLAGFYTWTFTYEIYPLTDFETLELPVTSGATVDWTYFLPDEMPIEYFLDEAGWALEQEAYYKGLIGFPGTEVIQVWPEKFLNISKEVEVHFMVDWDEVETLNDTFWQLVVFIVVFDEEYGYYDMAQLDLVMNQTGNVVNDDYVVLPEGYYYVAIVVYSWTGAVQQTVSGSFTIKVYAVETELEYLE